MDIFMSKLPNLESIRNVNSREQRDTVQFVGTVNSKPAIRMSKNGNRYLVTEVGDESDNVKVMMFGDRVDECQESNRGELPKEKDIIVVRGQKQEDNTVFANTIKVQTNKIYTRFSELDRERKKEAR